MIHVYDPVVCSFEEKKKTQNNCTYSSLHHVIVNAVRLRSRKEKKKTNKPRMRKISCTAKLIHPNRSGMVWYLAVSTHTSGPVHLKKGMGVLVVNVCRSVYYLIQY